MLYIIIFTVAVTLLLLAVAMLFIGKYYWGPSGPPDRAAQPRGRKRR